MFVRDVVQIERPFEAVAPHFLRDPAWLEPLVASAAGQGSVRCQRGIARSRSDSLVVPMRWAMDDTGSFPSLEGDFTISPAGPGQSQLTFEASYTLRSETGEVRRATEHAVETAVRAVLEHLAAELHPYDGVEPMSARGQGHGGHAKPVAETTKVIDVFADIVCPFTHVGLKRLAAYRDARGRDDVVLRVHAWPLELVNGELLSRDLIVEEIAELRGSVAPELFIGFDPELFPMTSLPALALANRAYRTSMQRGELVSLALRDELFEQGIDLSDPAGVARIGARFGVSQPDATDEAAVFADFEAGRARGAIGSPHFFVDGEGFFCPTLAIRRIDGHMQISFDSEGFTAFIARCFKADG
jgi:predicted DsbA family dithiol-disulfide isomerase